MAKTSKIFSGKTDTMNISSRLLMISFTKRFISRAEFEISVNLPDCDTSAPDLCSTRSLGSKASTPQDGDEEGISGDSGNGETGDDETNVSAVVGDNSAKCGGKSEYERT